MNREIRKQDVERERERERGGGEGGKIERGGNGLLFTIMYILIKSKDTLKKKMNIIR